MGRALHAVLALGVEISALWGLGAAGWALTAVMGGETALRWGVAAVLVGVVTALWARFAAPRSPRRLRGARLTLFKAVFLVAATLAFALAHGVAAGAVFAAAALLHMGLRVAFGDPTA